MKIENVDAVEIPQDEFVTVTKMNHLVEIQHMQKVNGQAHIKKLSKDEYVDLKTGEVKEFNKTENRSQGVNSLRQTFKKMSYLINNNFKGGGNELFVTLTYADQTNDHLQVGRDYDKFLKRFRYQLGAKLGSIDAIRVLEPHDTGNWHLHVLMRFNDLSKVYISNDQLRQIWGLGFVTIKSLKDVDNIGVYLSAYLTDVELTQDNFNNFLGEEFVVKQIEDKKFVKGGRLRFYHSGVNIYAKTKGIKYPTRDPMPYKEALKKVGAATPHFKKSIAISDQEKGFENTITYEQYNLKR